MIVSIIEGVLRIIQSESIEKGSYYSTLFYNARDRNEVKSWYTNGGFYSIFLADSIHLNYWVDSDYRHLDSVSHEGSRNHVWFHITPLLDIDVLSLFHSRGDIPRRTGCQSHGNLRNVPPLVIGGDVAGPSAVRDQIIKNGKFIAEDIALALSNKRNHTSKVTIFEIEISKFIEGFQQWLTDPTYRPEDDWEILNLDTFKRNKDIRLDDLDLFTFENIDRVF